MSDRTSSEETRPDRAPAAGRAGDGGVPDFVGDLAATLLRIDRSYTAAPRG